MPSKALKPTPPQTPASGPRSSPRWPACTSISWDRTAARAALREGRRALAGGVPPLVLLDVETALHQQDEHGSQALATARQGTNRPIPAPSWERSAWVRLRIFEAQALAAGGRIDAATARLADLPDDASTDERELFWVETGSLLWRAGQFIPAGEAYARAARFDPSTHSADQVRWMDRAATARYHGGDRAGSVEAWTQAMTLARNAALVVEVARIGATLASVLREVCRFEDAARVGQEAYDSALAAGVAHHAINAALAMGDLRLVSGATDEAATWFGRCAALVERNKLVRARARLARRWAELAVRIHDPRAMQTVSDALTAANQAELSRDACRVMALKAVLLGRMGRVEQLRPTLDRACAPLIRAGAARTLAEVRLWAAEALLDSGQPDLAIEEAARAVVWADEVGHTLYRTRADDLTARARAQAQRDSPAGAPGDLERLLEIAVALGGERELPRLLDRIVDAALHLVHADRAFVVLLDEAGDPKVVAARSIDGSRPGRPSSSVVHTTLKRGREVIVSDVAERGDLRAQDSIVHMRLRSALCVPMLEGDRAIGAIYVDSRVASQGELTLSTRLLRALAGLAGVAVTNARLLTESLQRAERAAEMAHDIRSPLSSVAMAAEQLVELGGLPEWAHETLELMEAQARRVMGLAERVLEDRPGQPRPVDLAVRAERLVGLAARDARVGGRALHFEAIGDAHILADPDELDRAITNLLANALQHTAAGTPVEVRVEGLGDRAELRVRDHGPGIPDALLPQIFERGIRSSQTGGHGLGLAITRRIVEAAGGSILARNCTGAGGAEFIATFPILQAARRLEGAQG